MPELTGTEYSEIDDDNDQPSPDGYPEGMLPRGVNNSDRATLGALKRFHGRINGTYLSTGAANTYVVTPVGTLAAYVTGERYTFRAHQPNTGSAQVNHGPGLITLQKMTGSGLANLDNGDIQTNQSVQWEYTGTVAMVVSPLPGGDIADGSVTTAKLADSAVTTVKIANNAVETAKIDNDAVTFAKFQNVVAQSILMRDSSGSGSVDDVKISALTEEANPATGDWLLGETSGGDLAKIDVGNIGGSGAGKVLQVVEAFTAAFGSGSTTTPGNDDTIPQSSEGNEVVTGVITPASTSNKLKFDVTFYGMPGSAIIVTFAVHRDAVADAIYATQFFYNSADRRTVSFSFTIDAPSTAAQTYKLRVGANTGPVYWNGNDSGRRLGGVATTGFTITEIDGT